MNLAEITLLERHPPRHIEQLSQRYLSLLKLADLIEGEQEGVSFIQIHHALIKRRTGEGGRLIIEACAMGKVLVRLGIDASSFTDGEEGLIYRSLPGLHRDDVAQVIKWNDVDRLSFTQIAARVRTTAGACQLAG